MDVVSKKTINQKHETHPNTGNEVEVDWKGLTRSLLKKTMKYLRWRAKKQTLIRSIQSFISSWESA